MHVTLMSPTSRASAGMLGDVVARVVAGISDCQNTVAARERTDASINRGRVRQHEHKEDNEKAQRGRHTGFLLNN